MHELESICDDGEPLAGLAKRKAKNARQKARKKARREARWRAFLSHLPSPTQHALDRWAQRFRPEESFWECYALSVPVAWADLRGEADEAWLRLRLTSQSEFRRHERSGAVFVVTPNAEDPSVKQVRTVVRLRLSKGA